MNLDILMNKLAKPAQRALLTLNITTLEELSQYQQQDISQLHGIGKNALKTIISTLEEYNLTFSKEVH